VTEHEDYLFEVRCEDCGTRYNPFFESSPHAEETPEGESDAPPSENLYKESSNAFSDIVSFGENLNSVGEAPGTLPDPLSPEGLPEAEPPKEVSHPTTKPQIETSQGTVLVTAGDALEGYRVVKYFSPQSTWMDCDPNAMDPLAQGIEALWQKCVMLGANAVVAMQWRFSPDGSRILISGTPVYCDPT
jgi:hypothetical protein